MWKYLCTLLAVLAFTACHTNKSAPTHTPTAETVSDFLPEGINVSASFRMFWEAWRADLRQQDKSTDHYTPSELLIKRFYLREKNGEYLLSVYLHTDEGFNPENLSAIGGYNTRYNDSIYSFAIPLKSLPSLIALPGIRYIETASPVQNRQSSPQNNLKR